MNLSDIDREMDFAYLDEMQKAVGIWVAGWKNDCGPRNAANMKHLTCDVHWSANLP